MFVRNLAKRAKKISGTRFSNQLTSINSRLIQRWQLNESGSVVILYERFYSLIGSFAILGIRFLGELFFIDKNKIIFLAFTSTWSLNSTCKRTSLHSHPLYAPGKRRLAYRKHRLHRNLYYYWAEEKTFWFRLDWSEWMWRWCNERRRS